MKRGLWILLAFFGVAIALIAAFVIGSSTTDQRRLAARANLAAHVDKARAAAATGHGASTGHVPAEAEAAPMTPDELQMLFDTVEREHARTTSWSNLRTAIDEAEGDWPPDLLASIEAWMNEHSALIAQARALAEGGATLPEIDLANPGARLDHVDQLRKLNAILTIHARALAATGNTTEAVAVLEDAIALANLTGSQSYLLSQLASHGDYHRALNVLSGMLSAHNPSQDQIQSLQEGLRNAQRRAQFAAALAGEAQAGLTMFDDVRSRPLGQILTPFVNLNETAYVDGMADMAAVAQLPYYEASRAADTIRQTTQDLPFTRYFSRTMLGMVQPAQFRAMESQASHEARVTMARIALALESEYLQTGSYPTILQAVAPALDDNIPVDPFTGQSFVYRVTENGYLLYSLGTNGGDDEGQGGRDGDLVWGQ